jgi:prevent-host-death family protein
MEKGETVTILELRARLSEILSAVAYVGKTYTITRNGRAVAQLVPPEKSNVEQGGRAKRGKNRGSPQR